MRRAQGGMAPLLRNVPTHIAMTASGKLTYFWRNALLSCGHFYQDKRYLLDNEMIWLGSLYIFLALRGDMYWKLEVLATGEKLHKMHPKGHFDIIPSWSWIGYQFSHKMKSDILINLKVRRASWLVAFVRPILHSKGREALIWPPTAGWSSQQGEIDIRRYFNNLGIK